MGCQSRPIDGVIVNKAFSALPVFGLVIDNYIDSRPAKGLERAQLVYEVEVEGRITRFLAFYDAETLPEEIGPVRSARPYFVDWAGELEATLVHCGGSPEALAKIKKVNLKDLNEFYNAKYFWRDKTISAPHNIFSSKNKLAEYLSIRNINSHAISSWLYKKEDPQKDVKTSVYVNYGDPAYSAIWDYDIMNNEFSRMIGEQKYTAKNLVIQYVKSQVLDDKLRLQIETIGEGAATVCIDGKCQEAKWKKASLYARTKFYDLNSNEIEFNPGQTWIEVVNSKNQVSIE
jgi:hypothetical protein